MNEYYQLNEVRYIETACGNPRDKSFLYQSKELVSKQTGVSVRFFLSPDATVTGMIYQETTKDQMKHRRLLKQEYLRSLREPSFSYTILR